MRNWKSVLPALLLIPALAAGMLSSASSVYPEAVWAEEIQEAEELFPEPEESGPEGGEEEDSLPEAVSDEEAPVSGPEGSGEDEAAFPESSGEAVPEEDPADPESVPEEAAPEEAQTVVIPEEELLPEASYETPEVFADALREELEAFLRKGDAVRYDSRYRDYGLTPEKAGGSGPVYTDSLSFVHAVFYDLFGIRFPSDADALHAYVNRYAGGSFVPAVLSAEELSGERTFYVPAPEEAEASSAAERPEDGEPAAEDAQTGAAVRYGTADGEALQPVRVKNETLLLNQLQAGDVLFFDASGQDEMRLLLVSERIPGADGETADAWAVWADGRDGAYESALHSGKVSELLQTAETEIALLRPLAEGTYYRDETGIRTSLALTDAARTRLRYPGMEVTLSVLPGEKALVSAGETVEYRYTVRNHSAEDWRPLSISLTVPGGCTYVSGGDSISGSRIDDTETIAAGGAADLKIVFEVKSGTAAGTDIRISGYAQDLPLPSAWNRAGALFDEVILADLKKLWEEPEAWEQPAEEEAGTDAGQGTETSPEGSALEAGGAAVPWEELDPFAYLDRIFQNAAGVSPGIAGQTLPELLDDGGNGLYPAAEGTGLMNVAALNREIGGRLTWKNREELFRAEEIRPEALRDGELLLVRRNGADSAYLVLSGALCGREGSENVRYSGAELLAFLEDLPEADRFLLLNPAGLTGGGRRLLKARARLAEDQYGIAFDANASDASGSMNDQVLTVHEPAALTANAFRRNGYTFAGWSFLEEEICPNVLTGTADLTALADDSSASAVWTYGGDSWSYPENVSIISLTDAPCDVPTAVRLKGRSGEQIEFCQYDAAIEDGVTYTASAWIRGSGTFRIEQGGSGRYSDSEYESRTFSAGSSWQRVSFTFTPAGGMTHSGKGSIFFGNIGGSGTIDVCGMKLEKNGSATPWNAPEAQKGMLLDRQTVTDLAEAGQYLTLYAQWTRNSLAVGDKYTVRFLPNDDSASGSMADRTYVYGTSYTLPKNTYTRSGRHFVGWSTEAERPNLLPDSGDLTELSTDRSAGGVWSYAQDGWTYPEAVSIIDADGAPAAIEKAVRIEGNNHYVAFGMYDVPMEDDTTYTLSCYVRGSGSFMLQAGGSGRYDDSDYDDKDFNVSFSDWKRVSFTFTTYGDMTHSGKGSVYFVNIGRSGTVDVCGMKLEKGNFDSGWTDRTSESTIYSDGQTVRNLSQGGAVVVNLYAVWESNVYSIAFSANGGSGSMASLRMSVDDSRSLLANRFRRTGSVFRGWNTAANGSGTRYGDLERVKNLSYTHGATVTLYAQWELQPYLISYDGNGADSGSMEDQQVPYGTSASLRRNTYKKAGYLFAGWEDENGKTYTDGQTVSGLSGTTITATRIQTLTGGSSQFAAYPYTDAQGGCVYEENGHLYLVAAMSNLDTAYYNGDLSHYDTVLLKYDLTEKKMAARKQGLMYDHGNGVCYNPDNGHLYIAECGMYPTYPRGVMEVDSDLNFVAEYSGEPYNDAVAIAYYDHEFYIVGSGTDSSDMKNVFVCDEQLQIRRTLKIRLFEDDYVMQGMGIDPNYLYTISANFSAYSYRDIQRVNVYRHDGTFVATWYTDIPDEVEDMSVVNGTAYFNTQYSNTARFYEAKLPVVRLTAKWTRDPAATSTPTPKPTATVKPTVTPKATPTPTPVPRLYVTDEPSTQTVAADQLHKFIVEVNLTSGNTYQWQVSEDGGKTWRDFSEKKTSLTKQLWFTVTEAMHGWQFRCRVKNGSDTVWSTPFTVYIEGKATPRPTATPKPTATATPKPTATPRPTATPTPKPTATLKPTATPTPAPKNILKGTANLTALSNDSSLDAVWTYGGDSWNNKSLVRIVDAADPPVAVKKAVQLTAKSGSQIEFCQYDLPISDRTAYTASCYVKGSGTFRIQQGGSGRYDDSEYDEEYFTVSSTSWRRVSFTFTTEGGMTHSGKGSLFFGNVGDSGTIEVCGMMLEKGSSLSAWDAG